MLLRVKLLKRMHDTFMALLLYMEGSPQFVHVMDHQTNCAAWANEGNFNYRCLYYLLELLPFQKDKRKNITITELSYPGFQHSSLPSCSITDGWPHHQKLGKVASVQITTPSEIRLVVVYRPQLQTPCSMQMTATVKPWLWSPSLDLEEPELHILCHGQIHQPQSMKKVEQGMCLACFRFINHSNHH